MPDNQLEISPVECGEKPHVEPPRGGFTPRRRTIDVPSRVLSNVSADSQQIQNSLDVQRTKRPSLQANFALALVGNLVYAASQWGMLVVLAKLGSPEIVGQFALALAVTAPIIMLSMLQLRIVQATDATREYQFGHYLALRIISSVMAVLIIGAAVLSFGYHLELALTILLMGLLKAVESVGDACHGLMQQRERMDRIALSQAIKGPLFFAALAVTVFFTGSVVWGVAAMVATSFGMLFSYERTNVRRLLHGEHRSSVWPLWECPQLVRLAWLALPLGLVSMLVSLNTAIPRYFIERMLGERQLGYFAALAYLQVVVALVATAITHAITPRLSQFYASGERAAFLRLLLRVMAGGLLFGVLVVTIAAIFGRELLTIIYRPDYADNSRVFVCLMIAVSIATLTGFLGSAIHAARRFCLPLPTSACTVVVTLTAAALMIPEWGLLGAALATLSGVLFRFTCNAALVLHILQKMPRDPCTITQ